jgi:hypothetical protein
VLARHEETFMERSTMMTFRADEVHTAFGGTGQ